MKLQTIPLQTSYFTLQTKRAKPLHYSAVSKIYNSDHWPPLICIDLKCVGIYACYLSFFVSIKKKEGNKRERLYTSSQCPELQILDSTDLQCENSFNFVITK